MTVVVNIIKEVSKLHAKLKEESEEDLTTVKKSLDVDILKDWRFVLPRDPILLNYAS